VSVATAEDEQDAKSDAGKHHGRQLSTDEAKGGAAGADPTSCEQRAWGPGSRVGCTACACARAGPRRRAWAWARGARRAARA
jgi:hypothetical protein